MADGDAPTDAGAVAVEEHRRQLEELEGPVDDLGDGRIAYELSALLTLLVVLLVQVALLVANLA